MHPVKFNNRITESIVQNMKSLIKLIVKNQSAAWRLMVRLFIVIMNSKS